MNRDNTHQQRFLQSTGYAESLLSRSASNDPENSLDDALVAGILLLLEKALFHLMCIALENDEQRASIAVSPGVALQSLQNQPLADARLLASECKEPVIVQLMTAIERFRLNAPELSKARPGQQGLVIDAIATDGSGRDQSSPLAEGVTLANCRRWLSHLLQLNEKMALLTQEN